MATTGERRRCLTVTPRSNRNTMGSDSPPAKIPPDNGQSASIAPKVDFTQAFGLDLRVAMLAVIVDWLAFSGSVLSLGLLVPVELGAAVVLGIITYKIQKSWYGDTHDSALIKSLVIGLLTAIPAPITGIVAGPGGLLGIIHWLRRKR